MFDMTEKLLTAWDVKHQNKQSHCFEASLKYLTTPIVCIYLFEPMHEISNNVV